MRKKSRAQKPKQPSTIAALARVLGISRQALGRHVQKPAAPGLGNVSGWQEYLAAHGRAGSAPPELRRKIAAQRLRLLRAMVAKAERENQKAAGQTLDKGEVQFALSKGTNLLFSGLDRLANVQWPASLKGCGEAEISALTLADVEKLKDDFRDALEKLASEPTSQETP